ncbi:MAG: RNHCP domain-containing protein [Candidatus Falkowbacteria bacterium]
MPKFTRTIEDFTCEHCGTKVKGNGYTNHCPKCFYSKHVDINPGDRESGCGGMMRPIGARPYRGGWRVIQQCLKCGHSRENKVVPEDDMEKLAAIIKENNEKIRQ